MLKLNDLKVGMRVNYKDLSDVFETVIVLADLDEDYNGTIYYIGDHSTQELRDVYAKLDAEKNPIFNIYNLYESEEVCYDE
ncbi:MAG: hypothetical protein K2M91_00735 [Lachnospiraceae bacterium]|nr:hypothetical protein [Lachnospiraceae bacterium]